MVQSQILSDRDALAMPQIQTRMRFYKPLDLHKKEKPYSCEFDVSSVIHAKRTNIETEDHDVIVHDIRGFETLFTLENNGFEIQNHHTSFPLSNFDDLKLIETQYLPECEDFIRQRLRANQVKLLGFNVRSMR